MTSKMETSLRHALAGFESVGRRFESCRARVTIFPPSHFTPALPLTIV
jgi:hypothetical protein